MFRTLGAVVASLLIAASIAPSAHAFVDDEVVGLPGMRDNKEPPVGIPFVLPEGVELVEPMLTYNFFDENDCKNPEDDAPPPEYGAANGAVQICMVFNNRTGRPINIEFPPGIIVESESTELQNGILIQTASIEVPAKPIMVKLKFDCANVTRTAPAGLSGARYRLGPVTQHPHIVEALRLLADRDLSERNDSAKAHVIVSDLLDGDPLTARHRAEIAELPAKQP